MIHGRPLNVVRRQHVYNKLYVPRMFIMFRVTNNMNIDFFVATTAPNLGLAITPSSLE